MVDVTSIMNNPIIWVVALVFVVSLVRKAYRKVTGLLFTGLAILKLVHYLALFQ